MLIENKIFNLLISIIIPIFNRRLLKLRDIENFGVLKVEANGLIV